MKTIGFKLSKEEYEVFKKLALAKGLSPGEYAKQIVIQHLQGKIREAGIEKILKELLTEFTTQRELLLSIETKLDTKKEDPINDLRELLEEILEKVEKLQAQAQSQPQGQSQVPGQTQAQSMEFVADILSAFKEVGKTVIVLASEKQAFMTFIDTLIKKYKKEVG